MPKLPLEGIRVIDMCVVWAGPFGSALLGDLGAEVIRVETVQYWDVNNRIPGNPEAMRERGATDVAPDATPWDTSPNANSVGRNKRSVTIDLRRPEGQEVFHRLVARERHLHREQLARPGRKAVARPTTCSRRSTRS